MELNVNSDGNIGAVNSNGDDLPSGPDMLGLAGMVAAGLAQAGATDTITLQSAGPSAVNEFYVGCKIRLTAHTGAGQSRIVTAYNGTTKVATVDRSWAVTPDSTTEYRVFN
jgi:hypothetical protein